MSPERIKYLELIQAVVNRLAGNSFSIKGWTVAIVAGLFALAAKESNPYMVMITVLPSICFWGLDAYYLRQEKLFRKLFNQASLPNSTIEIFSMDTRPFDTKDISYKKVAFSKTIKYFHFSIFITIIIFLSKKCINWQNVFKFFN